MARQLIVILLLVLGWTTSHSVAAERPGDVVPIATFEGDNDGFAENLTRDTVDPHGGDVCGRVDADFSPPVQASWVTIERDLKIKKELSSISFWVRSTQATGITFRLVDASGQVHQQRPIFEASGKWQQITISTFDRGLGYQRWGGANDGKFHWPAKQLAFLFEKGNLGANKKGSLWIDDIEATISPNATAAPFSLEQNQLGNIFTLGEPVRFPIETLGDRVTWTMRDFWQNEIGHGETPVHDGYVVVEPVGDHIGYFELTLESLKGNDSIAKTMTTFAVIAPADLKSMPDSPFGVMTHFAQGWDLDIMPLVAKAGIKMIRDEHYWQDTEPTAKGKYVFIGRFSNYLARAKELGIDPVLVMDFANRMYDNDQTPNTPEGLTAFANYGVALLNHYGKQIKRLEVWNEYNGTWCSGPPKDDRPRYHALMCKYVYERVKAVRPDVEVLGGAAVLLPPPYFEGIFKNGGLNSMDGVVIHPYRGRPEGVETEVAELRDLMRKYDNGKEKPIWATETGNIDPSPGGRVKTARYLAKQYTLLLTQNAKAICWYLMRDYNEFKSMGLLRDKDDAYGRYAPAPAYAAYANLIQQMYGTTFVARDQADKHTYVEVFKKGNENVRVCWSNTPVHVALATAHPVTVVDLMGGQQTLTPVDGQIFLTLTDDPIYVRSAADAKLLPEGRFTMDAGQQTDMLATVTLRFAYDNIASSTPLNGAFEVLGKQHPFVVPPGTKYRGEVQLPDETTKQVGDQIYYYRLLVDSKPAAVGGISFKRVDGLRLAEPLHMTDSRTMELSLANTSVRTAYKIRSIGLTMNGDEEVKAADVTIDAGQCATLRVPVSNLLSYTEQPVSIKVELDGRAPFEVNGLLSSNPIPAGPAAERDAAPTQGAAIQLTSTNGKSKIGVDTAWDERALSLLIGPTDEPVKVGIAPTATTSLNLRHGWYEFLIDPAKPSAKCTLSPDNAAVGDASVSVTLQKDGLLAVSIPWKSVAGVDPKSGWVRMALAAPKSRSQWGGGILLGRTPLEYRVCHLLAGASLEGVAANAEAVQVASVRPIAAAVTPPSGKLLADFDVDFSNVQGRSAWSYGYFDGSGNSPYADGNFKPLDFVQTMWGYEWSTAAVQYAKVTRSHAHPGVLDGRAVWVIRRWTSNVDGQVRVSGTVELSTTTDPSDGVGLRLLVDGVVHEAFLAGGAGRPKTISYDVIVPVKVGSNIDIAITPGPGLNVSWDTCAVTSQIHAVSAE